MGHSRSKTVQTQRAEIGIYSLHLNFFFYFVKCPSWYPLSANIGEFWEENKTKALLENILEDNK